MQRNRVHFQFDARNFAGLHPGFVAQADAAVDGGMHDQTAGKGLVGVLQQLVDYADVRYAA